MKAIRKTLFAATLMLAFASVVQAQSTAAAVATTAAADEMSAGEVRKVDKATGKMTIRHGPLKNLGMDAMTMVFRVQDPAMLDQVKAGDRISFVAAQASNQLTVTRLQKLE